MSIIKMLENELHKTWQNTKTMLLGNQPQTYRLCHCELGLVNTRTQIFKAS